RLAPSAWRAASAALADGPVLVQVPRHGYLPALSCQDCRQRVRCPRCQGPVTLPSAGATALCRWCALALPVDRFQCPHCQGRRIRSAVVGSARTAEELGRAFPGVRVLTSSAGSVLETVGAEPTLVVATPGAEPVADGGYAACLLLDAWALLDRADLDAPVEALRRWMTAAALVRPGAAGGVVVLVGVPEGVHVPAVDALVRWAPEWLAGRELDERQTLTLPPTVLFVQATGDRHAVAEVAAQARAVDAAVTILGPLPVTGTDQVRVIIRAPLPLAAVLADTLVAARAVRSARKEPGALTVRLWDRVSG
ncbi:MAG: primosome assembly protein PriA, partial [Candidatus Phosphoribacter sp.]